MISPTSASTRKSWYRPNFLGPTGSKNGSSFIFKLSYGLLIISITTVITAAVIVIAVSRRWGGGSSRVASATGQRRGGAFSSAAATAVPSSGRWPHALLIINSPSNRRFGGGGNPHQTRVSSVNSSRGELYLVVWWIPSHFQINKNDKTNQIQPWKIVAQLEHFQLSFRWRINSVGFIASSGQVATVIWWWEGMTSRIRQNKTDKKVTRGDRVTMATDARYTEPDRQALAR